MTQDLENELNRAIDIALEDYRQVLKNYNFEGWLENSIHDKLVDLREWYKADANIFANKIFPLEFKKEGTVEYIKNANYRVEAYLLIAERRKNFAEIHNQNLVELEKRGIISSKGK